MARGRETDEVSDVAHSTFEQMAKFVAFSFGCPLAKVGLRMHLASGLAQRILLFAPKPASLLRGVADGRAVRHHNDDHYQHDHGQHDHYNL